MNGNARAHLLAALADAGVDKDDYALIEQARILVDTVNARLRARSSAVVYSVTFCVAPSPPLRAGADVLESA
jgi:hypothetical protein